MRNYLFAVEMFEEYGLNEEDLLLYLGRKEEYTTLELIQAILSHI